MKESEKCNFKPQYDFKCLLKCLGNWSCAHAPCSFISCSEATLHQHTFIYQPPCEYASVNTGFPILQLLFIVFLIFFSTWGCFGLQIKVLACSCLYRHVCQSESRADLYLAGSFRGSGRVILQSMMGKHISLTSVMGMVWSNTTFS